MIDRRGSWEELQTDAEGALQETQEGFSDLFRSDSDREGWGQYIDPPAHRNHTGIYGTGSGIQVSSMADSGTSDERIQTAQEWLIDEWTSDGSDTVQKGYKHLTCKHAFCLFGLSSNDTAFTGGQSEYDRKYSGDVGEIFTALWEKRIENEGWGEFWLESELNEMDLQSSALSALALLSHEDIRNKTEYEEMLKTIGKRAYQEGKSINRQNIGNGNKMVLTIAFCLLALSRYRNVVGKDHIDIQTAKRINQLGKIITKQVSSGSNIEENTYSISLISLPDSDELPEDAGREHYMIFLVYPIVTLALLEAGTPFVGQNHIFIRTVVKQYTDSILGSNKGCFSSSETGRCSTHDHLWIAAMLHKYSQTDLGEERWRSRAWGHLKGRYVTSAFFVVSLLGIAIFAAFYAQPANSATVRALANLVIALLGALLGSLKPVLDFKDYVHYRYSSLL
jgi:hypothetical protein